MVFTCRDEQSLGGAGCAQGPEQGAVGEGQGAELGRGERKCPHVTETLLLIRRLRICHRF